ncbi:MAG: HypC/HybG/HupF family hydrogenase formation chaperone [Acidobacteria bacterium]|nr:HypC/HybG/HupF family hydrogenase formation chaperone [Acidobacteriota bacterium]
MCVAIPMKIQELRENNLCVAEIGGVSREISLMLLPDARVDDYVIVHAGFAIEKLDEKEALATIDLFRELDESLRMDETDHE